jgi:hypothetical protein
VLTVGQAATKYIESQRFIAALPIWMLLAGCGVVAIARWLTMPRLLNRAAPRIAVTLGIVTVLTVGNLRWIAADERQFVNWGDPHGLAVWDIGWRLAGVPGEGAGIPVTMAGEPYLFLDDWDSLTFLAPGAIVADVVGPTINPNAPPPLPDGAMLLLTGERASERCHIEAVYPGVTAAEVRARNGQVLYLAFYRGMLDGWATGDSPEGTTWAPIDAEPCPTVGMVPAAVALGDRT